MLLIFYYLIYWTFLFIILKILRGCINAGNVPLVWSRVFSFQGLEEWNVNNKGKVFKDESRVAILFTASLMPTRTYCDVPTWDLRASCSSSVQVEGRKQERCLEHRYGIMILGAGNQKCCWFLILCIARSDWDIFLFSAFLIMPFFGDKQFRFPEAS